MSKFFSEFRYLQARRHAKQPVYITACAVVIDGKMLFAGNTHQECIDKATRAGVHSKHFMLGFLGTDGKYYEQEEAGYIAYARRQTDRLCDPLQAEDL